MIKEEYVSFEVARLLKDKGFDEKCSRWYVANEPQEGIVEKGFGENQFYINSPTLQMAMKWLREVHDIDIIAPPQYDSIRWTYSAIIFKLSIPCTEIRLNDNKDKKEEACEAAIKYCLENLI